MQHGLYATNTTTTVSPCKCCKSVAPEHVNEYHRQGDDSDKRRLEEDAVMLTPAAAVGFVLVSSTLLLVLYFFLNNALYWVLVGLYTTGAVQVLECCGCSRATC